jgi:hypothetical protein
VLIGQHDVEARRVRAQRGQRVVGALEPLRLVAEALEELRLDAHEELLVVDDEHAAGSGRQPRRRRCFVGRPTRTDDRTLGDDPEVWLDLLRDDIDSEKDWPLVQVLRTRMDNFRDDVRIKAWSFVLRLMARHPDRFGDLMLALADVRDATPEQVAATFARVLGRDLDEAEAEWREWASGSAPIARATGFAR